MSRVSTGLHSRRSWSCLWSIIWHGKGTLWASGPGCVHRHVLALTRPISTCVARTGLASVTCSTGMTLATFHDRISATYPEVERVGLEYRRRVLDLFAKACSRFEPRTGRLEQLYHERGFWRTLRRMLCCIGFE